MLDRRLEIIYNLLLVQKRRFIMYVIVVKLVTGEDVLGELDSESPKEFVLKNPVGVSIVRGPDGQPNVGFTPFPMHAEQKSGTTMALSKSHIVYDYVPAEDFITNYNQIFGTGIITPPEKKLIVG
jgi:hypothetical protein